MSGARRDDPVRAIARAVLYEGYVLWPYRRSAPKNQRRWTFGGVHPRPWSVAGHDDDAWRMCTECLVELPAAGSEGTPATVRIELRFLQVVERRVARVTGESGMEFVDEIEAGGSRWVAWDEAREREVVLPPLRIQPGTTVRAQVAVYAASEREWLENATGERAAAVVRSWRGLAGEVTAACERVAERAFRIRVDVANTTEWTGRDREDALRSTFASTHVVLRADGCAFVSLTDPPAELEQAAASCRNDGWWPVLVGARGARDTVLASPIILPDHPAIAPESPGDLFDGGEIDELLTLHVLALSDAEKREARATDPRTREILDRTTSLEPQRLLALHGVFRDPETGAPSSAGTPAEGLAEDAPDPFWVEMGRAPAGEIVVDGTPLRRGSRVRLHPHRGGDVMDVALAGRTAIVEGIDEDDAGGVHLSVVIEGDPGLDLGMARYPGHRFFFRPEEVEPLRSDGPPRVLVAGVGNIFLGDDGFGVELARRLAHRPLPDCVRVRDFGIRGMDLAYALQECDALILVDAAPRGGPPGTLYVIDAAADADGVTGIETHGMDPAKVIAFARALGPLPERILVVGCEPAVVPDPLGDEIVSGLSEPVRAAVDGAILQVEELLRDITRAPGDHLPYRTQEAT